MKKPTKHKSANLLGDLFERKPTKSELTRLRILEAAIRGYVQYGIEGVTYDKVSKLAKVSRPLVMHYFPSLEALFEAVAKFVRAAFQKYVVDRLAAETLPRKQLEAYVKATFRWVDEYPDHGKVWLLFYFECARSESARAAHTEMTTMGAERIQTMFAKPFEDSYARARMIQVNISGALTSLVTEDRKAAPRDLEKRVVASCLALAGF